MMNGATRTAPNAFATFSTWDELLAHLGAGKPVWYRAPLDILPTRIRVKRVFKNGKVRVWSPNVDCDDFTCDTKHLDRFRYMTVPNY